MERYFMSMTAQLILQSGGIGKGGEILLLIWVDQSKF